MDNLSAYAYRTLIVDDAPRVRQALRWALDVLPNLWVVGEAGTGEEALQLAAAFRPDVVLLDMGLPDHDSAFIANSLKSMSYPPAIVYLALQSDSHLKYEGLGGDTIVEKGLGWDVLAAQVTAALVNRTPAGLLDETGKGW